MHKIGQQNVNSIKTTLYYGRKKLIGFPYFPSFHEKITALAHIWSKKRPFSKNQTALMSIFSQKNVHSLKNMVLSCHFF